MSAQEISSDDRFRLRATVATTFTPGRPVKDLDLLAGRNIQVSKVFDAVLSPGQHAAIYGDRGVGKSSLANLIYDMIFASGKQDFVPVQVNCGINSSFPDIWAEVFRQIEKNAQTPHLLAQLPEHNPNPEDIRSILTSVDRPIIIVLETLRVTPAMEAGIANHVWSMEELVGLLESSMELAA